MRRLAHPQSLVVIGLVALALYSVRHTFSSTTIIVFAVAVPSIILHELAHGVTALAFGDDTAKRAGRLTLNPVRHVDPIGTLVLPGVLALAGLGAFGYAKPVPINPSRMRNPRNVGPDRQPGWPGHQPGPGGDLDPPAAPGPAGGNRPSRQLPGVRPSASPRWT